MPGRITAWAAPVMTRLTAAAATTAVTAAAAMIPSKVATATTTSMAARATIILTTAQETTSTTITGRTTIRWMIMEWMDSAYALVARRLVLDVHVLEMSSRNDCATDASRVV